MAHLTQRYRFDPEPHLAQLVPLLVALAEAPTLERGRRDRILARHPKAGRGFFSKSELLAALRWLRRRQRESLAGLDLGRLEARLRGKPVRTLSGVAVVTVFTRPHPCPGRCVFCPSDVRMPKSYLADEPGCQRALSHGFDPYDQTRSRLRALWSNGHTVDKVELLVLGGTWSSYPDEYQHWFLLRCFEAFHDFAAVSGGTGTADAVHGDAVHGDAVHGDADRGGAEPLAATMDGTRDATVDDATVDADRGSASGGTAVLDGRLLQNGRDGEGRSYNSLVSRRGSVQSRPELQSRPEERLERGEGEAGVADRERLRAAQRHNETAGVRCVGLVLETRPDRVDAAEVARLRRLGATKVQLGVQSTSDAVLAANGRGHDLEASRRAFRLLRAAGFKIQAHWMCNLLGSDPEGDVEDFRRLFTDPDLRPDELKIYPCSLVESAELMRYWQRGLWRPYDDRELLNVVVACLAATPSWCRLSRVIRDIPGTDIVAGSRVTNLRQVAEAELARRGTPPRDIRAREVRDGAVDAAALRWGEHRYAATTGPPESRDAVGDAVGAVGEERFLELISPAGDLAGFLRLSLPPSGALDGAAPEIRRELQRDGSPSAMIREVHVYGRVAGLEETSGEVPARRRAQHRGLGRRLVKRAAEVARRHGYGNLAVISAVGTRAYYRELGFADGELYQHRRLGPVADDPPRTGEGELDRSMHDRWP